MSMSFSPGSPSSPGSHLSHSHPHPHASHALAPCPPTPSSPPLSSSLLNFDNSPELRKPSSRGSFSAFISGDLPPRHHAPYSSSPHLSAYPSPSFSAPQQHQLQQQQQQTCYFDLMPPQSPQPQRELMSSPFINSFSADAGPSVAAYPTYDETAFQRVSHSKRPRNRDGDGEGEGEGDGDGNTGADQDDLSFSDESLYYAQSEPEPKRRRPLLAAPLTPELTPAHRDKTHVGRPRAASMAISRTLSYGHTFSSNWGRSASLPGPSTDLSRVPAEYSGYSGSEASSVVDEYEAAYYDEYGRRHSTVSSPVSIESSPPSPPHLSSRDGYAFARSAGGGSAGGGPPGRLAYIRQSPPPRGRLPQLVDPHHHHHHSYSSSSYYSPGKHALSSAAAMNRLLAANEQPRVAVVPLAARAGPPKASATSTHPRYTQPPPQEKNEKTHMCTVSGCERGFKRLEHLRRHLRTHTGEQPFRCDICLKYFSRSDNLTQHKKCHERVSSRPVKGGPDELL